MEDSNPSVNLGRRSFQDVDKKGKIIIKKGTQSKCPYRVIPITAGKPKGDFFLIATPPRKILLLLLLDATV